MESGVLCEELLVRVASDLESAQRLCSIIHVHCYFFSAILVVGGGGLFPETIGPKMEQLLILSWPSESPCSVEQGLCTFVLFTTVKRL